MTTKEFKLPEKWCVKYESNNENISLLEIQYMVFL